MPSTNLTPGQDAEISYFLSNYPPGIISLVNQLRVLVQDTVPEAVEQFDLPAKMLAYGLKQTYKDTICVIMPYKAYVNLGFPRGASLPDPVNLLTGTGKLARHVRISKLDKDLIPGLQSLIQESLEQINR